MMNWMKTGFAWAFVVLAIGVCSRSVSAEFVHPGVAHRSEEIEFIKQQIRSGNEPWAGAWQQLCSSRSASLDYLPDPHPHVERGPYNNPNIGSSEFSRDASAAYVHALIWVLGEDDAHAQKSVEIMDAWSERLRSISNHDARLLVGMSGYHFCIAAELMKHTWDGWPADRQSRFAGMLQGIWYPLIEDFYPTANGNWDAAMLQTMIAMGVFLDDQQMFDRATEYFLDGKGNGAIGNYFNAFGQCQESGRDQAHTQMGLEFLSNTCQTGWIQGIDLYGAKDNRLLNGFEYTAKYNLGGEVPYERYRSYQGRYDYREISDNSRGRLRPMYEKIVQHYRNRLGMPTPYSERAVTVVRGKSRSRRRTSSVIDRLMFAAGPVDGQNSKLDDDFSDN